MREVFVRLRKALSDTRNRAVLWAVAACLLIGISEFASPLDDMLRVIRNHSRPVPASGEIALVLIDGQAVKSEGEWPWPRSKVAKLVDQLREAGVERIAFDHVFVDTGRPEEDRALAEAFGRLKQRPLIATGYEMDPITQQRKLAKPSPRLQGNAEVVGVSLYFNGFGHVWNVPYAFDAGDGTVVPSLPAALADKTGSADKSARIDYAISADSIPRVSAWTVMNGDSAGALRGKVVVVGTSAVALNIPGGTPVPTAIGQILGAETLKRGQPVDLGWFELFLISVAISAVVWGGSRRTSLIFAGGFLATLIFMPIVLEANLIFVDVMPSLILLSYVTIHRAWRSYRRGDARINAMTGLPNLVALREQPLFGDEAVVAVRVKNYSELVSALSQNESVLAAQIAQRLSAGGHMQLYQGDEGIFSWIVPAAGRDELADQLDALHTFFLKPVAVGSWQVDVSVAFGVDVSPSTDIGSRFASALVAADDAAHAGQRWKFYDPSRLDEAEWNMSLLGRLDTAIENGEVWVAYQPKLDVATNAVIGMEALVRWSHPERGAIPPEQFVSVAENNARIDKLTYFVLDDALETVKATGERFGVAVNLSARMFSRKEFVDRVRDALRRSGVPAHLLTMEVTESAAVENEAAMFATVNALDALGVKVSIDDYGTGYCTLDYLKKVKASELKIDRSFVGQMERSRSDRVLVKATIELAHSLGHVVVAEGVETAETLEMLREMNCDIVQGYLVARPMPRHEFEAFLQHPPIRHAA